MKNVFKILMCSLLIVMLSLPLFGCLDDSRQKGNSGNNTPSQNDEKNVGIDDGIKSVIESFVSDCYNGVETDVVLPEGIALPGSDLVDDVATLEDSDKINTIRKHIADKKNIEYIKSDISGDKAQVEVKILFSYDMASIEKAMNKVCQENDEDIKAKTIVSKCFDDIIKAIDNPGENPIVESVDLKFSIEADSGESSLPSEQSGEGSSKTAKKWVIKEIKK